MAVKKRLKQLKLLVSPEIKETILIYDNDNSKYHIWHKDKKQPVLKVSGERPTSKTSDLIMGMAKREFIENIDDFPNEFKLMFKAIADLEIEEKGHEFLLKDLIIGVTSNRNKQKENFSNLPYEIKLQYFNQSDLEEKNKISDDDYKINLNVIITNKINDFYLCYCEYLENDYYLLNVNDNNLNEFEFKIGQNPNELMEILDNVINENPNYEFHDIPNDELKNILHQLENDKSLLYSLISDLKKVYHFTYENQNTDYRNERINKINNIPVIESLHKKSNIISNDDTVYSGYLTKQLINDVKHRLENRESKEVELGRRDLSKLLSLRYGLILRKYTGTIYKLKGNGYEPTSHDDLIIELTNLFGSNFIHDNDIKKAIGYVSRRLEPTPNIIKFENTFYNMETLEPFEPNKPIFTVLNIPYNYNPNAKSELMENFLNSSFKRETAEETEQTVKGIKQLCGYFFTSGNSFEIIPIFTGSTGAGKSTLLNILTGIFGKDKISGISLQSLENDIHASSGFVGKHLNIIRDSDNSVIKNNSVIKAWTGNESYPVNPKFKDLFDLPAEEVPKPILACNNMPVFEVYEDAIIRRFVIVEFLVSITKKGKPIKDLDKKILENTDEVEWFIYESLKEYKAMLDNNESFIFKISDEETKELIEKHTHPLNHIIQMLICKHDPKAYDEEKYNDDFRPVFTDDLVEAILYIGDRDGIDVPVNKHGKIDKRILVNVIRDEFDLHDGEIVQNKVHDSNDYGKYTLHRDYKARSERWNGLNKKAYPNLIATKEYIEVLEAIKQGNENNKNS